MRKIGVLYGMENSFPPALIDRINSKKVEGVSAEHIIIGAVKMADPSGYRVIIDRISHDIDFYRAYLKNAVLNGTIVIDNPFWSTTSDAFFQYSLARKLNVAVPKTVALPHKSHPPGTTVQSMRNLVFPLNWDEVFDYVGFPAILKPAGESSWRNHFRVNSRDEFFAAYDQTGAICMMLQAAVQFQQYFRCYVVGHSQARVMKYDPQQPQHLRYARDPDPSLQTFRERIEKDAISLCQGLNYEFGAIDFAVQDGVPYVLNVINPAPDADLHTIGEANFDWVVENVAHLAIEKARSDEQPQVEPRWRSIEYDRKARAATIV